MNEKNKLERKLCLRFGSSASEVMFDYPSKFFRVPGCTGIIAYRIEFACAIVFGDPICPQDEIPKLTEAFHRFCDESNLNIIYIIVSESFTRWAMSHGYSISMEVCEELVFNPLHDLHQANNKLKHSLDKAKRHGLTIHEYIPHNAQIENSLMDIGNKWQQAIGGPHLYLGDLKFFESYIGKRWIYVKDKKQITAMAMLSKIESRHGWFLKYFVSSPDAYYDTSVFLMDSLLEILKNEHCRFLTKGMAPIDNLGEIKGFNTITKCASKTIYKIISTIFRFKKRKLYWLRYNPKTEPSYLILRRTNVGLNEIRALMRVFKAS